MTSRDGYVWFLPAWYTEDWWDVDYYNGEPELEERHQEHVECTSEQVRWAASGHLSLSHAIFDADDATVVGNITVKQWKEAYIKRARTQVGGLILFCRLEFVHAFINIFTR